ncbi:Alpha/Beta hydrolase protein [Fusarium acuminatum]|uniref:Alpha/Beta hydrolase protein n=1 Tax=Fusarium acuminatum TaxID=5515 RepID=A0ABZ2X025_9HYPO
MTEVVRSQAVANSLPWTSQLAFSIKIRAIQKGLTCLDWLSSVNKTSSHAPNIIKTYETRQHLPVRIFIPSSFSSNSSDTLPTLFTIHGGGFCIGSSQDDDAWNRSFADTHSILVVALNYSKAPAAPFPTGLDDLEALYLAALDDESLPIDRANGGRVAICGFSAGGNLTLGLCQRLLRSEHQGLSSCRPRAAISVYGALDLSLSPDFKITTRQYKSDTSLGSPRTSAHDTLLSIAPLFDWSYLPPGQDLRDPLVSPGPYARPEDLPAHVFVIASELDMLANESRECANRLAHQRGSSRHVSAETSMSELAAPRCGRPEPGRPGELELDDERFAWQETFSDGSVRWLLVPDVLHGFDSLPMRERLGGKETMKDAELKTEAYCRVLGEWLLGTVFSSVQRPEVL